jgi:hypothetical protein
MASASFERAETTAPQKLSLHRETISMLVNGNQPAGLMPRDTSLPDCPKTWQTYFTAHCC